LTALTFCSSASTRTEVRTLALDTSLPGGSVALRRDGALVLARAGNTAEPHAVRLPGALIDLVAGDGATLDDVHLLAVGLGPGAFTGLRVGLATMQGLAFATGVPIVGVSGLDALAVAAHRAVSERDVIGVWLDAGRQEVFAARYWRVPGGVQREGEYTVEAPAAIAAELVATGTETLLVGDGALEYADAFAGIDHVELAGPAATAPSVSALVELAAARFEREEFCRADEVMPLYLRRSDAEIAWDAR
jgi:tRNA threonylcarbamoyladenosine biosynthesis protein TsaB